MILGTPLGLIALAAVPAVVALHLWRRRFPPQRVSGLFLYGPPAQPHGAGRTRSPLVARASLWLEIAAALALAWALTDPHLDRQRPARHLVLVVDTRWSMQAADADGVSAWTRLNDDIIRRLAGLAAHDRATVVASGALPRLIVGPAATAGEATTALAGLRADRPDHDVLAAVALAQSVAGEGGEVWWCSDRVPGDLPAHVGVIAHGRALPTSGIASAEWIDDGRGGGQAQRIAVRVVARGAAARRPLDLQRADGGSTSTVELAAGDDRLVLMPPPPGAGPVRVTLGGADALTVDDAVALLPPPPRRLGVRVDCREPVATHVRRAVGACAGVALNPPGPGTHLIIADRDVDAASAGEETWLLRIEPGDAPPTLGPFLMRRGHGLLAGLDGNGALWSGAAPASPGPGEPLAWAGSAVLLREERGQPRRFTLHADPGAGTLADHPLWPSLFANLVELRRDALARPRSLNLAPGAPLTMRVPAGALRLDLTDPDGSRSAIVADAGGVVTLPALERTGLWTASAGDATWTLAVASTDAALADLSACATSERPATVSGQARYADDPTVRRLPIVALAAACLCLAWLASRREEGRLDGPREGRG